jgi:hypothetical protein
MLLYSINDRLESLTTDDATHIFKRMVLQSGLSSMFILLPNIYA